MDFGYYKVATAIPSLRVADCKYNREEIEKQIFEASKNKASLVVFPELSISGYSCGDLFLHNLLLEESQNQLSQLLESTKSLSIVAVVGIAIAIDGNLYNCGVIFQKGEILGIVPKTFLPDYKEFYEKRWFCSSLMAKVKEVEICEQTAPFGCDLIFKDGRAAIALELCEDLWMPTPPSSNSSMAGANIILNLSASNELIGKHQYLLSLISTQSARCNAAYIYSSAGFGESSTDLVFAGNGLICENGTFLAKSDRFSVDPQIVYADIDIERLDNDRRVNNGFSTGQIDSSYRTIKIDFKATEPQSVYRTEFSAPFVPKGAELNARCEEIFNIQTSALAKRIKHTHSKGVVVGISGGLDSTLALLVCVKTYDKLNLSRKEIVGVTMPGFGTTDRTYNNAISLMEQLGITIREISIKDACIQHFKDIEHDQNVHDITYENSQARERTQILMDVANQIGGMVIGTGDLSELALGWATYNGDHMSMYGVNGSIPKTLVKHLVKWVADNEVEGEAATTLLDIVETPISPELIPFDENGNIVQKTEDLVGPYILHDFFLYYFLRFGFRPAKIAFMAAKTFEGEFSGEVIKKWITTFFRRFFNQQFKRSCLPDGPKVGSISISPRGDWRMPSDASSALWLKECEEL